MTTTGRLSDATMVKQFIFAGNATVTLASAKTGNRFTYRVRRSPDRRVFFVGVLTGTDNETQFSYLGTIRADDPKHAYHHGAKSRIGADAGSAKAIAWFMQHLESMPLPQVSIWHEGKCGRCGRKLTTPESIERGIGPECLKNKSKE